MSEHKSFVDDADAAGFKRFVYMWVTGITVTAITVVGAVIALVA